jgi:hypothetical protein
MNDTHPDATGKANGHANDATLGGYFEMHDRPPAFEGSDGHPYTVSLEIERSGDLRQPYGGYLVFPRWAETGVGIVGHVETPTLNVGGSQEDVLAALGELTLFEVQDLLERAIASSHSEADA